MTPPAAVVFDLDGTLIDSRRDLAAAINRLRASYRLAELPIDVVVGMVGKGARNLVANALDLERQLEGAPPLAGEIALDEAFPRFLALYDQILLDGTRPYPGIPELLARLAARIPLAVLTNKPERSSRRLLEALGLAPHFKALIGGDTLPSRKPDPAGLRHLAEQLGVQPAETLLVGDSTIDAATAEAAGCPFALVAWGFPGEEQRAEIRARYRPACFAATAEELERFLLGASAR